MRTDYATAENTLRYYAICLNFEGEDPTQEWVNASAQKEVKVAEEKANKLIEKIDKLYGKQFPDAWFDIYELALAYRQQALEEGIKTGIRLMVNALGK